ncbi:uncharacterized protein TRUGW13939_08826 [Talaromyces rugulosus]|uniref:Amine oxidase domain-containing protein n=1 Tax=Talaromyces rugulosus TaxID=121627 RepID=A0A7H8RAP9_TALRU|nr:uncharacterized protein TRUGW13939_08826 [Talaromyces rugulosus]QKX61673.1 hypothetical protein TRUGW13939_08826 [Talaromyces rugulosus]
MVLRIAIVGSGISGLAAFWALRLTEHDVHLYERSDCLGGCEQVFSWSDEEEKALIDPTLTLYNPTSHPNLAAWLSYLQIPTIPVHYTFGVENESTGFGWSSTSLWRLFSRNIFLMCRMLYDIWRFHLTTVDLTNPFHPRWFDSIGVFLRREKYSHIFCDNYLIPLIASTWIQDPRCILSMPTGAVVSYLRRHRFQPFFARSFLWRSVEGGAKRYIEAIFDNTDDCQVHRATRVHRILHEGSRLRLQVENGPTSDFDHVILATGPANALQVLDATNEERKVLEKFRTTTHTVFLHSDVKFLPPTREIWAFRNYRIHRSYSDALSELYSGSTTTYINYVQNEKGGDTKPLLLTTDPEVPPQESEVQCTFMYDGPVYDKDSIVAQREMKYIQGSRNIWFTSSSLAHGLSEDGFCQGIEVARIICPELTVSLPFKFRGRHEKGGNEINAPRGRHFGSIWQSVLHYMLVCYSWWHKLYRIWSRISDGERMWKR